MPLYRHYKGPFYKTFGVAKHSETQEEFTVYETLYDSPGGRLWIRPKEMFEGNVEVEGQVKARFAPFRPKVARIDHATIDHIRAIAPLIESVFGWSEEKFISTFRNHARYFLLTASIDNLPVGFKLGYELDSDEFYSWLGGVDPIYRKFGVASLLMEQQHNWAKEQGYKFIQTKTKNSYREMLRLNIKHGFDVVGCHSSSAMQGDLKIVLRKALVD